jgi:hypothetical protein
MWVDICNPLSECMPSVGRNVLEVMGFKYQQSITQYFVLNIIVRNNCCLYYIWWVQELLLPDMNARHAFCQWLRILLSNITPTDTLVQIHK